MPSLPPDSPSPESSQTRVSIRDIAKAVGVSIMTVSLSLRNNPKISAATRERVRAAAESLGYRPDPEIARLMTRLHHRRQASDAPPMAILDLSPTHLAAGAINYCEHVRRGAVARAESLGYIASCFHQLDYEGDIHRLLKVLHYRGIRGILLLPPLQPVVLPAGLDWSPFSVIAASYAITPLQFHRVVPHQFIDMCRLIKLLEARGHKRIGAVFEDNFEERIHFHFTAAITLLGYGDNIYRVKNQQKIDPAGLASWLKERSPDALVCPFALNLQAALPPKTGRDRPVEIISLGATKDASLAFWDERPCEIGSDAAVLLAGMIQHNETGVPESPRTSMIHGVFHDAPAALPPEEPPRLNRAKAGSAQKAPAPEKKSAAFISGRR
jgi:LacI family transcriptional regulator